MSIVLVLVSGKWFGIMVHKHYLTLTRSRAYSRQNRRVNLKTYTISSLCLFRHREKNVPILLKSQGDVMKWVKSWKERRGLVNICSSSQKSGLLSLSISLTSWSTVTPHPFCLRFGVWINSSSIYVSPDLICHKSNKARLCVGFQLSQKVCASHRFTPLKSTTREPAGYLNHQLRSCLEMRPV